RRRAAHGLPAAAGLHPDRLSQRGGLAGGRTARGLRHATLERVHVGPRNLRREPRLAALHRRDRDIHGDRRLDGRRPAARRGRPMKKHLVAVLAGILFAAGLSLSGMTRQSKVLGFLDVGGAWDASLLFVMVGAIGVHAIAQLVARGWKAPLLAS